MQAVSVVLTLFAAGLLLHDRPFGRGTTVLAACGYYFVYEYSIIARPYVVALAAAAALATLYHRRRSRDPLLPAALCGLIASVSAYGALLSCALFVVVAGHAVRDRGQGARWRLVAATALWGASLVLSAWVVVSPLGASGFERELLGGAAIARIDIGSVLVTPVLPHLDRLPFGVGGALSGAAAGPPLTLVALGVLAAVGVRLRRDRVLLIAWMVAVSAVSAGALFSALASERHLGHLWIAALTLCWIDASDPVRPRDRTATFAGAALTGTLAWHATVGAAVVAYDVARPMTPWSEVAATVAEEVAEPYVLLTGYAYDVGPIVAELDRPVHDIHCDCFTRHYDWSWPWPSAETRHAELEHRWCELAAGGDQVVVLAEMRRAIPGVLELVADVPPVLRGSLAQPIRVWRLSDVERRRCASGG